MKYFRSAAGILYDKIRTGADHVVIVVDRGGQHLK
jgi:hypothetical protein